MSTVTGINTGARRALCALALAAVLLAAGSASAQLEPGAAPPTAPPATPPATETRCADGIDDDGDTVYDCGDADCFADPVCRPDGQPEISNARCSDWIDNDQDGHLDCDDSDCYGLGITVCHGSAQQRPSAQPGKDSAVVTGDIPELGPGMSVDDLIGAGGDIDGERNDEVCSDGIDNDNDGRIDCADFGCRFDRTVTVCQGAPEFRFSVVARAEHSVTFNEDADPNRGEKDIEVDSRFSTLQLRAFGPMPYIDDSFFLVSMRAERTPRFTFAMFQVPLGKRGHYVNVNSGGGGLSNALVTSAHKRLLLEPAYYLYSAFEQGNGGAVEIGGPIDLRSRFLFRTFVAGGSGRSTGNVGGTYIADNNTNYTYSIGGQLHINFIGYYSRWDSPILYTPAQTTLAMTIGAKYDQRAQERYPALNVSTVLRHGRVIALAESYSKRELEFESWQTAFNLQVGFLLIPKRLMVAADIGEYLTTEMTNPPADPETDLRRQRQETQWRAALHVFLWRNIFTGSLLYVDRRVDPAPGETQDEVTRQLKIVGQYRF